jgi:hypothetical protein
MLSCPGTETSLGEKIKHKGATIQVLSALQSADAHFCSRPSVTLFEGSGTKPAHLMRRGMAGRAGPFGTFGAVNEHKA